MVLTSPPYYGLRDYQTGRWIGGDPACSHQRVVDQKWLATSTLHGGAAASNCHRLEGYRDLCGRCGAQRVDFQLGLEATPEEYVEHLVEVFREVRRVLRDDGTVWLNLGDSHADGGGYCPVSTRSGSKSARRGISNEAGARVRLTAGLKRKDLVGIPWMTAFALRADGWYLRSAIVWHKPSTMPESVKDRPTSAYEHVFLLSKRATYYYDWQAIATESKDPIDNYHKDPANKRYPRNRKAGVTPGQNGVRGSGVYPLANARNVWSINPRPFKGSHFSTMPPELAVRCIKAGSRPGDMVLDPFGGAGTTALAARELGRDAVLIELNQSYIDLAKERLGIFDDGLIACG